MFLVTKVLGHLFGQRRLDDRLGQLFEQPVRAGQRQPPLPGLPHQLGRGLLLGGRLLLLPRCHIRQCRHLRAFLPTTPAGPSGPETPFDGQSRTGVVVRLDVRIDDARCSRRSRIHGSSQRGGSPSNVVARVHPTGGRFLIKDYPAGQV
jgi:hypothetical protein